MPIVPGSALRITPAWIAALAAAAVGMTLGYPVACIIFEHELAHRVPAAFVGLTTGLLSMLVVLRAAGRATRTGTAVSAASWSFIAGGLNAGLAAQYQASGGRGEPSLAPFALASVIGLVFASPLSAGFALVNAGLALGAGKLCAAVPPRHLARRIRASRVWRRAGCRQSCRDCTHTGCAVGLGRF